MKMSTAFAFIALAALASLVLNIARMAFRAQRQSAKRWSIGSGLLFCAAFIAVAVFGSGEQDQIARSSGEASTAAEKERQATMLAPPSAGSDAAKSSSVQPAAECEGGALGDVVAVNGSQDLRAAPSPNADRIINQKATSILGKTQYHSVNMSASVRRLCVKAKWTEVQIMAPEWLTFVRGWVPNEVLRTIEVSADGHRTYVEADIRWDEDTRRFKREIVTVINKIGRDNPNCSTLDTGSISKSGTRSKPGDPVFFVMCGSGALVFNVWFRPGDAKLNTSFTPIQPIGRSEGISACEQAAKSRATHPSTVSFSRFLDVAYTTFPSGRAAVDSSFTSRNSFNLEIKFRIRCMFEGAKLIEADISEAG